ncbi:cupin domain-containing protein [Galbibacter sp. BG1]
MNTTINAQYNKALKVETLLDSHKNGIGQHIKYPTVKQANVTMKKITFPPGSTTGWHKHSIPVFSYIIQGKLTVETKGHETKVFSRNTCFSESYNTLHQGSNKETTDLVVIAIYLGGDELPLSIVRDKQ